MRRRESASSRGVAGSAAARTASSDHAAFIWEALRQSAQQQALHGEVGDGDGRDAEPRAAGVCLGGRALRLDDAGLQVAGRAAAHLPTKAAVTCGEWCRVAGVTRGGERAVWSVVVMAVRRVAMSGPRGSSPRLTRVRLLALGRSPLHSQSPLRTQRRARYG